MDYWIKDKDILLEGQIRKISDEFVDELILCRKSKKLTQQDIADRSGMKRENISRIENKKNTPTIDVLYKYAECLGMKMQIRLVDSETNLDKMEEKSGR